ncbi:MAG: GntR family transcriptional regulator [Polycyclovorans sp.]|nr:GntR family transcriptional regulator [Polycyclovorans sp.]MBU0789563.1 GntR family transcriptional regulator [Gammaproteobacteria bacterium]MDP1542294.1 GntR family transcriptional regulator [Polycyclovorans sp.]MEC8847912.1 GntR family transcriptional regulator [Pseudomonadota bacterium]
MDTRKISPIRRGKDRGENLADRIYNQLKQDIFEFRLLPGDRFSENEIAERVQASRTPVREALFRLQREGYVDVLYRSGWQIRPFDFKSFEDLYDVRIIIETAAVKRLCEMEVPPATLNDLKQIWLVPAGERLSDGATVSQLDERFHEMLVEGTGNVEMAQMHHAVTERIRIIRRLDFTKPPRIDATYTEHGKILRAVLQRRADQGQLLLKTHIEESKAEVRKITVHMLHTARRGPE